MELKSEKGQTLVEYILLIVVALSLAMTFYNSEIFKRLFGPQGELGKKIKHQNEFSYRHAYFPGENDQDPPKNTREGATHPSYYNQQANETRFFGPLTSYPQQ